MQIWASCPPFNLSGSMRKLSSGWPSVFQKVRNQEGNAEFPKYWWPQCCTVWFCLSCILSLSLAHGLSSHKHNSCWAGGPPPHHSHYLTLMKLQADMTVVAALLWQCLQSCYLAGLPVQCQVEEKPLRLHLLFYLLGCCYVFWLGAGYQSRQNQLSKALHIWHTSYPHAAIAKWHLTWEPDLPQTATLLTTARGNPPSPPP